LKVLERIQAQQVLRAPSVQQAFKEQLVLEVQQDHKDHKALQEAQQDRRVQPVHQEDRLDQQALRVYKVQPAHKEQLVRKVQLARKDQLVHKDQQVYKDQQVLQDQPARGVQLVYKEILDRKE
jgi:hypothetical protein